MGKADGRSERAWIILVALSVLILVGCSSVHREGCTCGSCGQGVLCRVVTVYDGETFTGELQKELPRVGKRVHVKVAGIECPKGVQRRFFCSEGCDVDAGGAAKKFTESKLRAGRIVRLDNIRRQEHLRLFPFDRTVCVIADVDVDGRDLASMLVQARHAEPKQ